MTGKHVNEFLGQSAVFEQTKVQDIILAFVFRPYIINVLVVLMVTIVR